MNRRSFVTWAVALIPLLIGGKAGAWEADVHEGLTKWLAQQAGFTEHEADQIAQGDGGMDESDYTSAPQAVFLGIILRGDLGTSEKMQEWHFPSYAQLPCAPESRAVVHDSPAARDPVRQMIDSPYSNRDRALHDFGERLHAFQDSWSHEGVPDTPFRPFPFEVRRELIWAHPAERGGWHSHDADLTHLHVDQTVEMALRTYALLGEFRAKNPGSVGALAAPNDAIARNARAFAALATAQQKRTWFVSHGFNVNEADKIAGEVSLPQEGIGRQPESGAAPSRSLASRILQGFDAVAEAQVSPAPSVKLYAPEPPSSTTTRDGGSGLGRRPGGPAPSWQEPQMFQLLDLIPEVPYDETQDLARTVQRLMDAWIVDRNVDDARGYFDAEEIHSQLAPLGLDPPATDQWIARFLTMWLVRDHGIVNAAGHGMPDAAGYRTLPLNPLEAQRQGLATIRVAKLRDAVQAGVRPFKVAPAPDGMFGVDKAYIVYFSFVHAPRDLVMLVMAQKAGFFEDAVRGPDWRVVRALWVAL